MHNVFTREGNILMLLYLEEDTLEVPSEISKFLIPHALEFVSKVYQD